MTDGNVLRAVYSDLKTVKTRSTVQIILEMPIEGMADAFALLGAPIPGNEVWVAVARLREGVQQQPDNVEQIEDHHRAKLSQIAGILCNKVAFWRFLEERGDYPASNADEAANYVRLICSIGSRTELDTDPKAAAKWIKLKVDFDLWLKDVAA